MQFELLPPVPAVVVARELRKNPLFRFVSVDELFRFATIARQVRHPEGGVFQRHGSPAEYIQVMVEGRASVSRPHRGGEEIVPPAILGFREVLEGTAYQETATAKTSSICVALEAGDFRTMLSENIEMAEGLFRMLLPASPENAPPSISRNALDWTALQTIALTAEMRPIDKALLLQALPLFSQVGAEESLALAGVAREVLLEENATLFAEGDSASIWVVLTGELSVSPPSGEDRLKIEAGDVLGTDDTLVGRPLNWRGRVERGGRALKVEREPLFEALADRMDLLQGLFRSLFQEGATIKRGIA